MIKQNKNFLVIVKYHIVINIPSTYVVSSQKNFYRIFKELKETYKPVKNLKLSYKIITDDDIKKDNLTKTDVSTKDYIVNFIDETLNLFGKNFTLNIQKEETETANI